MLEVWPSGPVVRNFPWAVTLSQRLAETFQQLPPAPVMLALHHQATRSLTLVRSFTS
jgi:hypothetical protein